MATGSWSSGYPSPEGADHALWIPWPEPSEKTIWCSDCRKFSMVYAGAMKTGSGDLYVCRTCGRSHVQ